ncbi:hypothetical protein MKW94_004758 [Papaver nudicaule]|uniref:Uncharacterized protein n=1 Tax=Papaver nudicaule TaxID=74823 RepID=A0AA41SJX9_PAPNU|nr:hypothetical protein [Papaver nudicaule]
MEVAQNFHMNGGTGETSYSSNSFIQRKGIEMTKPIIEEAILDLISENSASSQFNASKCLNVSDMGCSSGPNTLLVVSYIVDTIYRKFRSQWDDSPPRPKILAFVNDLPCNDFTTTFKSLGSFYDKLKETCKLAGNDEEPQQQPCFVAAIPGSFYGRLFPDDSLHFVHSSYSLHWLSKIPRGIEKCNKGNIYMAESTPPNVVEAYMKQFNTDFSIFLKCRSQEVVKGGRMVLTILGRGNDVHPSSKECCYIWELLANALNYMMTQGKLKEEDLDSFNIPHYIPSASEVKSIILSEGSFFINQLQTFEVTWDGEDEGIICGDDEKLFRSSNTVANCIRAASEPLLVSHFGEDIMDELFEKYREIIAACLSKGKSRHLCIVMSMTRG